VAWLVGSLPAARPVRLVAAVALLCAAVVVAVSLPSAQVRVGGGAPAAVTVPSGPQLPIAPLAAVGPISAVLGRDSAAYRVGDLTATNAEQDMRAQFSSRGVTVVSGRLRLGIALDGYGYAGASGEVAPLAPVKPTEQANRVVYAYGALREWWANGPAGLEQGFTVSSRPGAGTGPLMFSLRLSGNVRARLGTGGLYLSGPGGALAYDDLAATDARGRPLPARFALRGGQALIYVDDRGADYPVRVDPLVEQSGELISADGTPSGEFGRSVAVSGNTVAVAADNQTVGSVEGEGAVYVFVEPPTGWAELMTQTAELVPSWRPPPWSATTGYLNPPALGYTLAMSGTTIVASSTLTCNKWGPTSQSPCLNRGAAYVFVEPPTGWSGVLHQSALLTASNLSPSTAQLAAGSLGYSVAVSGGTVVVGAVDQHVTCASDVGCPPGGVTLQGEVYVFDEPAGGWSGTVTQSAELTPPHGAADLPAFGNNGAVAVSGGTIVVGAGDEAYVFDEPAAGWSGLPTYDAQLTGPSGAGYEGSISVAVSGSSVAVGVPAQTVGSNTDQGAVFVYNEPTAGWSGALAPAAELTASDGTQGGYFGGALAMSGSTIVSEQRGGPGGLSYAYLFSEPATGWSGQLTESSELVASNERVGDEFGADVALSCTTVVVGATTHRRLGSNASQGSAYVFESTTTPNTDDQGTLAAVSAMTRLGPSRPLDGARPVRAAPRSGVPASGATCPLDVTVTPLEPLPVRAGLALHSQPYAPSQYPVDFVQGKAGVERCESGCVDLKVTVSNPLTQQPVKGATVNATISEVGTSVVSGKQSVCAVNELGTTNLACGLSIIGSSSDWQTDGEGNVYLRYWAPGVVEPTSTLLKLVARTTCSKLACPTGQMVGPGQEKLSISPDLAYTHNGSLSKDQVEALGEWARGGNGFTKTLEKVTQTNTVLKLAIKVLEHNELLEEEVVKRLEVVEQAEPLALVIDVIDLLTALGERSAMVAEFFYATDLDAVGLGADPTERAAVSFPSLNFSRLLVNFGVAAPFHFGVAGAWWDLANTLRQIDQADHGPIFVDHHSIPHDRVDMSDWGLKLKVWEVSTCDPSAGYCTPGYSNDPGSSTVLRAGIKPVLCLDLVLTYNGYYYTDFPFETSYDAIAWEQTQWNLQGLVRG
jgi:hypothetical protein